eukprot:9857354-Ditylum_brightwellii.AAC.1
MEEVQDRTLNEMKSQLETQLSTQIAGIIDVAVSKMHKDMKSMMDNAMPVTSNMIKASISSTLSSVTKGESSPHQTAFAFGSIKHDSASGTTENKWPLWETTGR